MQINGRVVLVIGLVMAMVALWPRVAPEPTAPAPAAPAEAHGEGRPCASCHAAQARDWAGSQHAVATAELDVEAHLARFDGRAWERPGLRVVPTTAEGAPAFDITDSAGRRVLPARYTLAVSPLQQYLIPGDGGRWLVAPIAWDLERGAWIDPAPEGASGDPADPLYWGGLFGTWNHMCAECHMTGLNEGYDVETQTYDTSWDGLGVGCTSCHGRSAEVDPAAAWADVCGDCHARRSPIAAHPGPGAALLDHAVPALLDEEVYTATGALRPREEAFELGSFMQSRMYAAGVTCLDCHEPHSGRPRAEGNALCTRCHEPTRYDAPAHHRHSEASGATGCVGCHMPTRTYMAVDVRHDHRFQRPHPATAAIYGDPDPCGACHDEPVASWWPGARDPWADVVLRARAAEPGVLASLMAALTDPGRSAFARASAAALLARYPGVNDPDPVRRAARDADGLVRAAALATLSAWGVGADEARGALSDPLRAVRFAALRGLFGQPGGGEARRQALAETADHLPHPDSPSSWTNLAVLRADAGDVAGAERDLRAALRVEPRFTPARQNLAILLAQQGRRAEAEQVLRAAPAP